MVEREKTTLAASSSPWINTKNNQVDLLDSI